MNNVIIKGLPDHIIQRILPKGISTSMVAYANINTVILMPIANGRTYVIFDYKDEWNYLTKKSIDELFRCMSEPERR